MSYDPNAPRYHWLVTCRDGTRVTYEGWQRESDVRACHNINYANWESTLMADTVARKDTPEMLSAEELETYEPGHNCTCRPDLTLPLVRQQHCSCHANWTPKEVYVLRNTVCDLEKEVDSLKSAVAKNHEIMDRLRDVNRAISEECGNHMIEIEALKKDLKQTAKELSDAGTAFSDYVSDVLANQDRMQNEYEKVLHQMQNNVVTNYALEA